MKKLQTAPIGAKRKRPAYKRFDRALDYAQRLRPVDFDQDVQHANRRAEKFDPRSVAFSHKPGGKALNIDEYYGLPPGSFDKSRLRQEHEDTHRCAALDKINAEKTPLLIVMKLRRVDGGLWREEFLAGEPVEAFYRTVLPGVLFENLKDFEARAGVTVPAEQRTWILTDSVLWVREYGIQSVAAFKRAAKEHGNFECYEG